MSKTPITVYLDFKEANALKAKAEALDISQSQLLGRYATAAVSEPPPDWSNCKGWNYLLAFADIWIESQPDAEQVSRRIRERLVERDNESAINLKFAKIP